MEKAEKSKYGYVTEDSQELRPAFKLSIVELVAVLDRKRAITDVTRVAASTLSSYSRIKSTEIHDKALEIMLTRKDIGTKALTAGEET